MNPYYNPYMGMPSIGLQTTGPTTFGAGVSPSVRVSGGPSVPQPGDVNLTGAAAPGRRERAQQMANQAVDFIRGGAQKAGAALQNFPVGRYGLAAGLISPVMTAAEEAAAGRATGAAGALVGGGAGAAIGAGVARFIPGTLGKVAQAVLPAVGGMLGAPLAASSSESIRQSQTGEPTKGKEGEFSTQLAMSQKAGELGTTQYRNNLGVETSALKDLSKHYSDQAYYDLQRNVPIIEKMKNADLIRQQALMNTQGQIQGRLGVLATGGALAQGAQAETGATLRTALTSNPYAGSTIQAPAIRFG